MNRFLRASAIVAALVLSACLDKSSAPLTAPGRNSGVLPHNGGTAAAVTALDLILQPDLEAVSGEMLEGLALVGVTDDGGADVAVTASLVNASAGMMVSGNTTVVSAGGFAVFDNLTITGAGTANLKFTAGDFSVTSDLITITCPLSGCGGPVSKPPKSLVIALPLPSTSAESGVPFALQPKIQVVDEDGTSIAPDGLIVIASIASGTGGTLEGTTSATTIGGVATFTNLQINGAGTFTLAFSSGTLIGATSANVVVTQVAHSLRVVTQPGGAMTGSPLAPQPTVELLDAASLRVLGATNQITATGPAGTTLTGTTGVNAVNGLATFTNLVVNGAGTWSLVFAAAGVPPVTSVTSNTFVITALPAKATKLAVLTQPSATAESGVQFATQPVIVVLDSAGTLSTTADGSKVTVYFATDWLEHWLDNDDLDGTMSATIVNGRATFTNLKISGAGTFKLKFWAKNLTSVTSDNVVVTQVARSLRIVRQPDDGVTGSPLSRQPKVELRDAAGLRVDGATNAITASLAPGSAGTALTGTTTVNAVDGLASFTNLVVTGPGKSSLVFSAGAGITPVTSDKFDVTPPRATKLAVVTQPSATAVSGVPFAVQPVIEVQDATGTLSMTENGSKVRVSISSYGDDDALDGTTYATIVNGRATFTNLKINGAGTFKLKFTANDLTSATSGNIVVTAPPVVFNWQGFFDPIDNLPAINKDDAGSTIPIKFSLGGNKGLKIFAAGYPASQPASCTTWAPLGAASPIATRRANHTGSSGGYSGFGNNGNNGNNGNGNDNDNEDTGSNGLTYDNGKYQVDWATEKGWANSCRILIVKLTDGSEHTAKFSFKK